MAIENLGEPHLGTTVIPKEERVAWPGLRFVPPAKIEFIAAESVVNEVYFCRSTAMARAKELLRADVIYMVFHLGVLPDSMYHSTFGAGIVVADEDPSADDAGRGYYHDACNGLLIVEHTMDGNAKVIVKGKSLTQTVSTVGHFHVARYGTNLGHDEYAGLDIKKLYRDVYEETKGGIAAQELGLTSFGTGIRQYLPTYYHGARSTGELKGELKGFGSSPALKSFCGLRVPRGLPARRTYDFAEGLPKHHIYYLNFPGSHYFVDEPGWR